MICRLIQWPGNELSGYSIGTGLLYQPHNGPDGSIVKYEGDMVEVGGGELIPDGDYEHESGICGSYLGTCNGYVVLWQSTNGSGSIVAINEEHTYVGGLELIRQVINNNFNEEEDDEENDIV